MPAGGYRPGSGRKPKVPEAPPEVKVHFDPRVLAASGMTPLEVMVEVMRFFRAQAAKQQNENKSDRKFIVEMLLHAVSIAKDAAPYMHAKIYGGEPTEAIAPLGKKEIRSEEARTAGIGTEWEDIIRPPAERAN